MKISTKYYALFLSLFVSINLFSQNTLLYEISGNGLQKPSYIFGTIHMMCEKDFSIKDHVKRSLVSSEQVYMEIDMDEPSMMMNAMKMMILPDGKTIKDLVLAEHYEPISKFLKDSLNINLAMYGKFKPFAIISMAAMSMLKCPVKSYEQEFLKLSKETKKEILGLEKLEEQMGFVDKIYTLDKTDSLLMDFEKNWTKGKTEFAELIKKYKEEDVEGLYANIQKSDSYSKNFERDLFTTRNLNWVAKLPQIMSSKSTFIAVGSGHLGGKNGVLQLLRDKGYSIKPIVN
ncbi:MAG: TraB/GumN family protein [Leadbetterella sp.]